MKNLQRPDELEWHTESLPDVYSVHKDCWILVWLTNSDGKLVNIFIIHPWENELNPLRWCDSSGLPLVSYFYSKDFNNQDRYIKYWAFINE